MVLESDSEMRGEFGMGYVCGGGSAGDASLAYAQEQTPEWADLIARANAKLDLERDWRVPEFTIGRAPLDPDLPF